MARKFSELKAKMSQQAQARLEAKAKALLDEMSSTDQPEQESQAQKRTCVSRQVPDLSVWWSRGGFEPVFLGGR